MTLYEFVTTMTDKRLPHFEGAGVRREGAQVHFGKGRGVFFLSQCLTVQKRDKGRIVISNTPYAGERA